MDRSQAERRVIDYLDEHNEQGISLLRDLVRIRSLARQEGTVTQSGTLVARLRPELGQARDMEGSSRRVRRRKGRGEEGSSPGTAAVPGAA